MFSAIKSFLELCRIGNLPTVWTNVLTAVVLSGSGFSWFNFLILGISMSFFYSGGMCLNDICDADIDRIKKPFRPLPSKRVSIKNAYLLTIVLFVIALAFLFFVPHKVAVFIGFMLLVVIIAYDMFHKVHPVSVVLMAACRLIIFVITAIAVTGTVGLFVAVAGSVQFMYILLLSVITRYEKNLPSPSFSKGGMKGFPIIPLMIAFISLIDGIVMAIFASPEWLAAGVSGIILTLFGQRYFKGD